MDQAVRAMSLAAALAALAACDPGQRADEQALIAEFDLIGSRDGFVSAAVGPQWRSDEITVRFSENGTLRGDINGVPVTGQWEWRDDEVCTAFRVSDAGGSGCSQVGIKPGELLVIPRSGEGAPYTYTEV